jgi:hypothetical protein
VKTKTHRVWLSLVIVLLFGITGATLSSGEVMPVEDLAGQRCNCSHPVTGHYGTICTIGPYFECCPTDCWIPLD